MSAIELRDVAKHFGPVTALDGVSIAVEAGRVFGLLGPNGAGKTTLLSLVSGFLHPDAGHVRILGEEPGSMRGLRGRFSILPQDAGLQPARSLLDQLVLFDRLAGASPVEARRAAVQALAEVGLEDEADRPGRGLSHGMHKRAAIAQALLGDPEVLLLDEPTAGLDPENARRVRDLVRRLAGGRTLVISSHNLQEIEELCDDVAILHRGRVAEAGRMEDLTSRADLLRIQLEPRAGEPSHACVTRQVCAALEQVAGVRSASAAEGGRVRLELEPGGVGERTGVVKQVLQRLLELDRVPRELVRGASLESRFLEIAGDDAGRGADDGG